MMEERRRGDEELRNMGDYGRGPDEMNQYEGGMYREEHVDGFR